MNTEDLPKKKGSGAAAKAGTAERSFFFSDPGCFAHGGLKIWRKSVIMVDVINTFPGRVPAWKFLETMNK